MGCRLSEALKVKPSEVDLNRSFVLCGKTKNGLPRAVHLPPVVVSELANIDFGED
jgi:integrase